MWSWSAGYSLYRVLCHPRHRTRHRNSSDSGEEVNEVIVEDEPGPSSTMEPSPANEKTRSVTVSNHSKLPNKHTSNT